LRFPLAQLSQKGQAGNLTQSLPRKKWNQKVKRAGINQNHKRRVQMKINKTMTDAAITANRQNAQKSTGPVRTEVVNQNARKHGLLAKKLLFETDEERNEFEQLADELNEDKNPIGKVEQALLEEVAICFWKLRAANGWEQQEIAKQRAASKAIMQTLADQHDQTRLPLFTRWNGGPSAAQFGWDCHELLVRCDKADSEQDMQTNGDRSGQTGRTQIEARLTASQDSILRYQTAIKRDLYRALSALCDMQRERRKVSNEGE
jgi:hypothetical protein